MNRKKFSCFVLNITGSSVSFGTTASAIIQVFANFRSKLHFIQISDINLCIYDMHLTHIHNPFRFQFVLYPYSYWIDQEGDHF